MSSSPVFQSSSPTFHYSYYAVLPFLSEIPNVVLTKRDMIIGCHFSPTKTFCLQCSAGIDLQDGIIHHIPKQGLCVIFMPHLVQSKQAS